MKRNYHKLHRMKQRKSIFKKPVFWWSVLLLFLIAIGLYFLVFYEKIQISKITISGNEKVQTMELERLISEKIKQKLLFLTSQSIFLINSGKIKESILEKYPNIETVTIKRKLPDTITVDIKERKPFVILCGFKKTSTDNCFFLDEKGIAFEEDAAVTGDISIVQQFNEKEIILGKQAVKKEVMESIVKIQRNFEEILKLKVEEFNISSLERLDVKNNEGWQVYFNIADDVDLQITKLNLLLEKDIPQKSRLGLKYIDLRFKDRAYYK